MSVTRSKPGQTDDMQPVAQPELPVEQKAAGKKNTILIAVLAILLLAVVIGALNAKNLSRNQSGKATSKCQTITKVKINPEKIAISPEDPPVELSALAYETENTPIWQGVSYDWGISSSNSVGTLKQNNDLVTFIPLKLGTGDLFVKATNVCTKTPVTGSIQVTIQEKTDKQEMTEPTITVQP